ncbi:MAG: hypothetical protein DRR19_12015 [Candidatus Parabeggiatoa sp. nov. 1]|nr:MAG: hypothetical protein DRR19_12015 [Gammaproteobacteria bacterium]
MNIRPAFSQGIKLKPGCHDVRVIKKGYMTQDHLVTITNKPKKITVELEPRTSTTDRLYIDTTPKDAVVKVDGTQVDSLKEGIPNLKAKRRFKIEVSHSGYKTCVQKVKMANRGLRLKVNLERDEISLPKAHTFPIRNLEPGEYDVVVLSNGIEQQRLEMTVQNAPLELRFTKKEKAEKAVCHLKTHNDGTKEVSIKGQYRLRFVQVESPNDPKGVIDIALSEAQAEQFYRNAQQKLPHNSSPLMPLIFRAVSENAVSKVIPTFWIQQEPINSALYQTIISDGSADNVSYDDATKVINTLNEWCKGTVQFELPGEQQFVHLARTFYNPVETGQLKACDTLRKEDDSNRTIKKLLGYQWQLTRSRCQQFDIESSNDPARKCDEQMYVKKGGSIESRDATECMPEYRAQSAPDIREPNTTFRLILLE